MVLHLFEDESENPEESKDDVFGHGEVVVSGAKDIIIIKNKDENEQKQCSCQTIRTMFSNDLNKVFKRSEECF